jgi:hypothetical protein
VNPYQPPKSLIAKSDEYEPWLKQELRRALLIPPLLVAPVAFTFALMLSLLDPVYSSPGMPAGAPVTWAIATTAVAFVAQWTYGVVCYLLLRRFRALNLSAILVASILPVVSVGLVFARSAAGLIGIAMYLCFALVLGTSSWYFASTHKGRRAL